jgi:hypothetical protein
MLLCEVRVAVRGGDDWEYEEDMGGVLRERLRLGGVRGGENDSTAKGRTRREKRGWR